MAKPNIEKNMSSGDSENIFNEFSDNIDLKKEVEKIEQNKQKWSYYYIKFFGSFFFSLNIILSLCIGIFGLYYYVQLESDSEYAFLSPVCNVFLWWNGYTGNTCKWVSNVLDEYNTNIENEKISQAQKIIPILWDVYALENFNLSKKVVFLLDTSKNKLRASEIITSFDEIKNQYSPVDKEEISCYDLSISDQKVLTITCDVFSSDWDTKIVSLKDGIKSTIPWWGTSITRASSFIYFIENLSWSPFKIINKPSSLSSEKVSSGPYTLKTTITLDLEYYTSDPLTF